MSKKFIVFAGVIFIIVFGVMQIAIISTLGVNANINLDRTIAIFSGFFSLFGGVIGATGAYFIAKEQIKKQDSMRKMDLKLEKFESMIICLKDMIKELNEFQILVLDNHFNDFRSKKDIDKIVERIINNIHEIENISFYFKFIDINPEKIMMYLEKKILFTVTNYSKSRFVWYDIDISVPDYLAFLNNLKTALEKEVDRILLD